MKVALYARVSTDEKHIRRLKESERPRQDPEVQLAKLREFAKARGYEVYKEYTDRASGVNQDRPAWGNAGKPDTIMYDAKWNRFDIIIATKIDRVARSLTNLNNTMQELKGYGVTCIFTDQDIDLSSTAGRMVFNFLGAIAEWEHDTISERVKEGMAYGKSQGKKYGRPEVGKKYADKFAKAAELQYQNPDISEAEISRQVKIPRATLQRYRDLWKFQPELPKSNPPSDSYTNGG